MARAQTTDFYQNYRFFAREPNGFLDPAAGFNSISLPTLEAETADYREGTRTYTIKQAGIPSVNEVTFMQGVARRGSAFFDWVIRSIEGGEYRTDLEIWHFHRVDPQGIAGVPSKTYRLLECWAKSIKPSGDLDAKTSDISIQEMVVEFEELRIQTKVGA